MTIHFRLRSFVLALLVWMVCTTVDAQPADVDLPPTEQLHLFLLVGQSNMAGRGMIEQQDREPHPRVVMLSKEGQWVPALAPLHFDKPPVVGVGVGRTFAIRVAEADPSITVGLIPCAAGGSPISSWEPGGYHGQTKSHPYDDAIRRAKLAMKVGTLKGILWHQGESDAQPEKAEVYEQKLHALIARFRKALNAPDVPFIAGQMGQFPERPWNDAKKLVDRAHRSLPGTVARTAFVDSDNLTHKGDQVHFDAASYRELGRRYAKAYLAILSLTTATGQPDVTLYVSPDGRDYAEATATEPLATLVGARNRVRQWKREGGSGPVTVIFASGTYAFDAAVEFDERDAGTEQEPIVYRASPEAEVRFTGGRPVQAWGGVPADAISPSLPALGQGYIRISSLPAQGITEYGKLTVHGFGRGSQSAEAELFYDDAPMTLARWPNEGFRGVEGREGMERVRVDTDRPNRWQTESDPWVFAYWHHDWAELHEPILEVDASAKVLVRSADVKPNYGITAGRARWYAYNLLSELDSPGEYYIDRETGVLYFWPPEPGGQVVLSQAEGLIRCEGLSHVTFRGFIMEACRGTAVSVRDGVGCRVVGCTIRNVGHRAINVGGGAQHEVYGCDIYQCGEGGIGLSGGDRPSLTPAGHAAENNHVHHYSRRARTYKSAIAVSGVGCRIAHNLIHHGPHMALSAGGNEHVVEFNEIHNVVYESGDAGAYYVGRDWTQRGNVLRYNYWHQIVGATGHAGMTIYLDDQHCGHTIHGNLFERCSRAVFVGGGDDNVVTNNVFLDCWRAAHVDNRGMGWQKQATDDPDGTLRTRLRAMPVDSDLWRQRYPTLAGILNDDPNVPKRNVFARNISAGGTWDDIHQGTRQHQTVKDNLVFDNDKDWVQLVKDDAGRPVQLKFKDPAAAEGIGFEPLPLERIGLYEDPRRASWPVRHAVEPVKLP